MLLEIILAIIGTYLSIMFTLFMFTLDKEKRTADMELKKTKEQIKLRDEQLKEVVELCKEIRKVLG